jgi:phosphatidylglycerophosphate synthase
VRVESPALLETQGSAARAAATRAVLRATGKPVDGPLTRLFERRISQTISSVLLAWPVSPNAMTTVSLGIGLTGAALLATTDYTLRVVGAALFVFATIVDGCDGEIARSKFLESGFGKLYDTSVDIAVNAAVFVALGVGTWRELQGVAEVRSAALLLVAGGILAMAVVESVRRLAPVVGPGSLLGRAQAWVEWFATVEWCYIVLGLALIDELPFFFFGAAIGANVFAAVFLAIGVLAWLRG